MSSFDYSRSEFDCIFRFIPAFRCPMHQHSKKSAFIINIPKVSASFKPAAVLSCSLWSITEWCMHIRAPRLLTVNQHSVYRSPTASAEENDQLLDHVLRHSTTGRKCCWFGLYTLEAHWETWRGEEDARRNSRGSPRAEHPPTNRMNYWPHALCFGFPELSRGASVQVREGKRCS